MGRGEFGINFMWYCVFIVNIIFAAAHYRMHSPRNLILLLVDNLISLLVLDLFTFSA